MPLTRDVSQYCNITLLTAVLTLQRWLREELYLILRHTSTNVAISFNP